MSNIGMRRVLVDPALHFQSTVVQKWPMFVYDANAHSDSSLNADDHSDSSSNPWEGHLEM